ncbi:MAG: acetoacetate--CoA ligase [Pseudomonadota bacterium]|nr:acetoacetate--CoA ligase [Pseudomonadota bacterium]MEC7362374.1 acetoacetate--CoA ligase [Pseudomonadota bacterium]MEC7485535.1 acetoacetate--CoA ligase [Pseudomonadota bacterium]
MTESAAPLSGKLLWTPPDDAPVSSQVAAFASFVKSRTGMDWNGDFQTLWRWSTQENVSFWDLFWDWHGVIGEKGTRLIDKQHAMPGARFFPDATLNYAENMLANADDRLALSSHCENGRQIQLTRRELKQRVLRLAGWMRDNGIGRGDRVAAYITNTPETVIAMLATAAVGAVFSSCSPDFGLGGAQDRFGQIEPKLLIACDGYNYAGKRFDRLEIVRKLAGSMPSVTRCLIVPFLADSPDLSGLPGACLFEQAEQGAPLEEFVRVGFNDPLYILYSSGTTGAPKCIVHGVGGVTLQHAKELRLHSNLGPDDRLFFFTTCGWMMWNWMVSGLLVGASVITYEGNPFHPGPERLWQIVADERLTHFGVSAKYVDAVRNAGFEPGRELDMSSLRVLMSTGSPLSAEAFAFIYDAVNPDLQLASISGGTDLISCFVLGSPTQPVYAGEIQTRGLGMAVEVLDEDGTPVTGEQGELCCVKPFPSMPVKFWNDPDGAKYRAAYFEHFDGVWRHGDWATLTERGGVIIHGRSDATLNPGGVRIGTAEIYRQVESFSEIEEALVVGQNWDNDVRVILFVKLAQGETLDETLTTGIRSRIRSGATPRHVPRHIIAVADIPRTRSGKITELAVRDIIHGRPVKNTEALANAEALENFRNLPQLSE